MDPKDQFFHNRSSVSSLLQNLQHKKFLVDETRLYGVCVFNLFYWWIHTLYCMILCFVKLAFIYFSFFSLKPHTTWWIFSETFDVFLGAFSSLMKKTDVVMCSIQVGRNHLAFLVSCWRLNPRLSWFILAFVNCIHYQDECFFRPPSKGRWLHLESWWQI